MRNLYIDRPFTYIAYVWPIVTESCKNQASPRQINKMRNSLSIILGGSDGDVGLDLKKGFLFLSLTVWLVPTGLPAADIAHPSEELGRNQGYLLLDLQLERFVSEIVLNAPRKRRRNPNDRHIEVIELGPYGEGRHLLLVPLRVGNYRWARTSVPHFDLPFRLDKSEDDRWRFSIARNRINYVGQLVVRKERATDVLSVVLLNRIAMTRNDIESTFVTELSRYPLRHAGVYRDKFFEVNYAESKKKD